MISYHEDLPLEDGGIPGQALGGARTRRARLKPWGLEK
jgi:hypothetical protein